MIYRDPDAYSPWPVLWPLPDGSIGAGVVTSPIGSHPGASTFGRFFAMASRDGGRTWQPSDHPAHPANWPFGTEDEHMDRFATVLPDPGGDTFVTVGGHGFEAWDAGRLDEARSRHRWVRMLPERPGHIAVQSPLLVSRRSTDGRQNVGDPRMGGARRAGPVVLQPRRRDERRHPGRQRLRHRPRRPRAPLRAALGRTPGGRGGCTTCARRRRPCRPTRPRSAKSRPAGSSPSPAPIWDEATTTCCRCGPTTAAGPGRSPSRRRSGDTPPHLLKLADDRILCTHGYRRPPMGVRAVVSQDGVDTWDVAGTVVLRDDSSGHSPLRGEGTGVGDVGYPVSIQLPDGAVLTAYYLTPADNVTHCAATRYRP